jgi:hypothetical protein
MGGWENENEVRRLNSVGQKGNGRENEEKMSN